jgi:ACR3 family arsenite efflux pump ArsB
MIYPMMLKIDFKSVKEVGKNPKGLFLTWIVNWLIKPFTMYGIAFLFFMVIYKGIMPDVGQDYLAGAILLGVAPCTAMVFVWSSLTKGTRPIPWFRSRRTISSFCFFMFRSAAFFSALAGSRFRGEPYSSRYWSSSSFRWL